MDNVVVDRELLKKVRKREALSQTELAERSGVPLGTIKSVESGRISLAWDYAEKLAVPLNVSPKSLFKPVKRDTCVIVVALQKGGVGKTAISTNLAYALSAKNKVLIIDTDPQRSSSSIFGSVDVAHPPKNFYDAYMVDKNLAAHIIRTPYPNLDLIPSSFSLDNIDTTTAGIPMREQLMREYVDELREKALYDFVIIDTNPAFSVFNTSILYASDEVLIPVEPDKQSLDMLEKFMARFKMVKKFVPQVNLLGIVFNLREKNRNLSKYMVATLRKDYGDAVLKTEIDRLATVPSAIIERLPVGVYRPHSKSAVQYRELAKEVQNIVKNRKEKRR